MTDQLTFDGVTATDQRAVTLTERQALALRFIAEAQREGVSSDELGAMLHQHRREMGGRGHDRDVRCDYCQREGADMGAALKRREIVFRRGGVWVHEQYRGPAPKETTGEPAYDPRTSEWPEGF